MLNIFIGYDSKESVAFHVLAHSIIRRATKPVQITPVALRHLSGVYTRPRGRNESTEFSISRFLVPYLSRYRGFSLFMDCDMLCRTNIHSIVDSVLEGNTHSQICEHAGDAYPCPACESRLGLQPERAVWVCKHDYTPKTATKFLGQTQTIYPRKNWSSFMLFDNEKCEALTPDYVNNATPMELHRFQWLKDEQIGSLPLEWNWLVGEYKENPQAKILHYTLGGPWFDDNRNCENAQEWLDEQTLALR
jgi:hypothetical protein